MPSQRQHELLLQKPDDRSIEEKDGVKYIAHQYIRVELTRIFGFGNWSFEVGDRELISEEKVPRKSGSGENWKVTYRVQGTLSVTFDDGRKTSFTEYAADAMVHPQRDQCHDYAIKSAASGALRRCAMNLGSVFGLGLYFHGWTGDVIRHTIDFDPKDEDGQAEELREAV